MKYAVGIYRFSAQLPDLERYVLVSQIRRAVTSVPLNIAEGAGCSSETEFARFVGIAYRSLKEVVTCLELCERLYPSVAPKDVKFLVDEGNQISRMTRTFMQRLTKSQRT
jgi:four helix bundle protein